MCDVKHSGMNPGVANVNRQDFDRPPYLSANLFAEAMWIMIQSQVGIVLYESLLFLNSK